MKLDTDAQRELLLGLLLRVPFEITMAEALKGLDPNIVALVKAIQDAEVENAE